MSIPTSTKQFIISVSKLKRLQKDEKVYFFDRVKKHIMKKKKGVSKYLSRDVDKILYGA